MGKMNTLDYYNKNAKAFVNDTAEVEFHQMQDKFLGFLNDKDYILDFGCGSGRDAKYFLENGYKVDAIDGSIELCKIAEKHIGKEVKCMLFQDLNEHEKYDGIWACSSILHLNRLELVEVLKKMSNALKKDGVIYTSFKYGNWQGERNGRFFNDMNEGTIKEIISQIDDLSIREQWITADVRKGRGDEKWLNIILLKKQM